MTTAAVGFENVSRHFGAVRAVDDVSLAIQPGEFFAMLGPSGSGKTTCLRLIAGFDKPDHGRITLFGDAVERVPPYRRNVNTVFQDYALFPHLSVADNVSYALKIRGENKARCRELAAKALAQVQLEGLGQRRPAQLSGGQRQRVALARALIANPQVLLLDEPLGALDLKLREEMQQELKQLQRSLGITFVFVTHDQTEALSMADRIAVFNEGKLVQVDSPEELYHHPVDEFVARFVGSSNVLGTAALETLGIQAHSGSLRPEAIRLVDEKGFPATVISKSFIGSATRLSLQLQHFTLTALVDHEAGNAAADDSVMVDWHPQALHLMGGQQNRH